MPLAYPAKEGVTAILCLCFDSGPSTKCPGIWDISYVLWYVLWSCVHTEDRDSTRLFFYPRHCLQVLVISTLKPRRC